MLSSSVQLYVNPQTMVLNIAAGCAPAPSRNPKEPLGSSSSPRFLREDTTTVLVVLSSHWYDAEHEYLPEPRILCVFDDVHCLYSAIINNAFCPSRFVSLFLVLIASKWGTIWAVGMVFGFRWDVLFSLAAGLYMGIRDRYPDHWCSCFLSILCCIRILDSDDTAARPILSAKVWRHRLSSSSVDVGGIVCSLFFVHGWDSERR